MCEKMRFYAETPILGLERCDILENPDNLEGGSGEPCRILSDADVKEERDNARSTPNRPFSQCNGIYAETSTKGGRVGKLRKVNK